MANEHKPSTTSEALKAAGDQRLADDVQGLEVMAAEVDRKLGRTTASLAERLIFGPCPTSHELSEGGRIARQIDSGNLHPIVVEALSVLSEGTAFDDDGKISDHMRARLVPHKAHAFTVPKEFGGAGESYSDLAVVLEQLSANGLGCLAVELSGQLTIGAGSLLGYGSSEQRSRYLPDLANGRLMGFALTEVGVGVNAKKIQAYVEEHEDGSFRLFADGPRNKLWITSARHGGLLGLVARIGRTSKKLGLFVIEVPDQDIQDRDYSFWLKPSGVDAFKQNYNSRIHFHNYPVAADARIPGDGVEVLFYCLRLGRCMLAAMTAGYQKMLAHDSADFARNRESLGGIVARHELPRLAITEMLGNSLQSYALSHLSIAQDRAGVDLAGLRDLTKSASAENSVRSMILAEHVMGGRAFTKGHRVNESRVNLNLMGIVEGEDNMIRMGMVRDLTSKFSNKYLSDLLEVMAHQRGPDDPLRLRGSDVLFSPLRVLKLAFGLISKPAFWVFLGWLMVNAIKDLLQFVSEPFAGHPNTTNLRGEGRALAGYCFRKLRHMKWRYLYITLIYQLELTKAQMPLVRMGQEIEVLVSALAMIFHYQDGSSDEQDVSTFKVRQLVAQFRNLRRSSPIDEMDRDRALAERVGTRVLGGEMSCFDRVQPADMPIDWRIEDHA